MIETAEQMLVVGIAFGGFSFWDVRRITPELSIYEFSGFVLVACAEALLLLPMITIAAASACLAVTFCFEALGIRTEVLSTPIYFVCLYMPFGSVYFLTKRRALATTRLPK